MTGDIRRRFMESKRNMTGYIKITNLCFAGCLQQMFLFWQKVPVKMFAAGYKSLIIQIVKIRLLPFEISYFEITRLSRCHSRAIFYGRRKLKEILESFNSIHI